MQKRTTFNGTKISRTHVKNNILKVWEQCSDEDRYDWYSEAKQYAKSLNTTLNKSCGIIAALSALKNWKENKRIAKLFVQGQRKGLHTKVFINKAIQIFESNGNEETILNILKGSKIKSFFINIRYPNEVHNVTIDRHALSIAVNERLSDQYIKVTPKQYEFFSDCYKYTAEQIGISPVLLQSATWVKWRKLK